MTKSKETFVGGGGGWLLEQPLVEKARHLRKRGDEVRLVGFGNFSVTRRKASTGRNPRTGEPMQIDASSQPKFRPGKVLKDAVQ